MGRKFYAKIISLLIIICLLLSSCGASTLNLAGGEVLIPEVGAQELHTSEQVGEEALKSDFITLYFDEKTATVSVSDSGSGVTWHSLPTTKNSEGYAFGVTLYSSKGIYFLNTQDSSFASAKTTHTVENGVLSVNYTLADSEETAAKTQDELKKGDVFISFTVSYSLKGQSLYTELDMGTVKTAPGLVVGEINYLPFFGSGSEENQSNYILIPDGSGAIARNTKAAETDNLSVKVYGSDSYTLEAPGAAATVPVFGMKQSGGAFAAIITGGDALADINARGLYSHDFFNVGADFEITPVYSGDNADRIRYGESYGGKLSVVYKFLSSDNASYMGMAAAAREEFTDTGYMSSSKQEKLENIPFCLTLSGSLDGQELASTEQAMDILSVLKGKGVNNILLTYNGFLTGGIFHKNLYRAGIQSSLGGKKGLRELYEYTQTQNYTLLLGMGIFSSSSKYFFAGADTLSGDSAFLPMKNDLALESSSNRLASRVGEAIAAEGENNSSAALYPRTKSYDMYLMSPVSAVNNFSSFLSGYMSELCDGYLLEDAGRYLYGDSSSSRSETQAMLNAQAKAVTNYGSYAVKGGNIYSVYGADLVSDMNFDTYYQESENYEPVPFAQGVLHGYSLYTGAAIDAADPLYRFDMLRSIEYGAMPSFAWVFNESSIYYYGYYVLSEKMTEIVEFYEQANSVMRGLSDQTITDHKKVEYDSTGKPLTGVYCTEYSDGTEIYVNYTGTAVTTSGNIVVEPYNCVRVDR